jgi:hypothetical protein
MDAEAILDELIERTDSLDERASRVQGDRKLLVGRQEISGLIADYQSFYAKALQVLPPEFHEQFRDLYEGGFFIKRIKSFLESPDSVHQTLDPEQQEESLLGYWQHPFESTFHSSILEQRQILTLAKQTLADSIWSQEIELVERIGRGLPQMIDTLQRRHADRPAFEVNDEYDVQDLLEGVLRAVFGDVRPEDPSPTRAGGSSRVDFLLKGAGIVVETKMTRPQLRDRKLGDELIEDIERYRSHPDFGALVAIVYDPGRHIVNPRGLEGDLNGKREGLAVRVVIAS